MEPNQKLTERELSFLKRQIRNVNRYLCFSIMGITASFIIIYFAAFHGPLDKTRLVLAIILMLHARGNLKQHKDARLLIKLTRHSQKVMA